MAPEPITTPLPTVPQTAQTVLRIQATEVVNQFRPELSEGDIIKLLVRSIGPDKQGLLYYRGLLIPALLPDTLSAGDTIQAKVFAKGEQLKLQILETISRPDSPLTATLGKIPQLTTQISNELNQLLKEIKLSIAQSLPPTQTLAPPSRPETPPVATPPGGTSPATTPQLGNSAVQATPQPTKALEIKNPLIPVEQLIQASVGEENPQVQGEQILAQLRQIADPVVLERVKQSIVQFRTGIADIDPKATEANLKLIAKLIDQLRDTLNGDKLPPEQMRKLISALVDETKKIPTRLTSRDSTSLAAELGPMLNSAKNGDKAALQSVITTAEKFVEVTSRGLQLAQGSLEHLQQFEQLIESQQRLLTLNPLMHSLGEPAFILFPFLVQGLLRHSEVSINPPSPEEIEDEESGGGTKHYQRVSVTVPLTNLGHVTVDIAYCPGEVLVRFSVRDEEVRDYLATKISELEEAFSTREYGSLEYWISINGENRPPHAIFNSPLFLSTSGDSVV
jgi:hypothetical protein